VKFGRYTSRTPFPGVVPDDNAKLAKKLAGLKFYVDLENRAATGEDVDASRLLDRMREMGKWPGKDIGDQPGLASWLGRGAWRDSQGQLRRAIERNDDTELLVRHEIQTAPPDVLVTNYSMLEYMMLRPIERAIFSKTRDYFKAHSNERFLLVLDEAHLYRGAQGTEVAMLIRRLRERLELEQHQLQVITTSASFNDADAAKEFAAGLSGTDSTRFLALTGTQVPKQPSHAGSEQEADALATVDLDKLLSGSIRERFEAIHPLLALRGGTLDARTFEVHVPGQETHVASVQVQVEGLGTGGERVGEKLTIPIGGSASTKNEYLAIVGLKVNADVRVAAGPTGRPTEVEFIPRDSKSAARELATDGLSRVLNDLLRDLGVTGRLLNLTSGSQAHDDIETHRDVGAQEIGLLAKRLFPDIDESLARQATDVLVEAASLAKPHPKEAPLLAARVHRFFRGIPGIWACSNPNCTELPESMRGQGSTGRLFVQPQRTCDCGSRVFELLACKSCGTPFLLAYTRNPRRPDYLWQEDVGHIDGVEGTVVPLHLWLENPLDFDYDAAEESDVRDFDLETLTGRLMADAGESSTATRPVCLPPESKPGKESGLFKTCPRCRDRYSKVTNMTTKGDEPFQHLLTAQLLAQPPREDSPTALQGRKLLVFSDGRQPASRLAGKLKSNSLRDAVRPLLIGGLRYVAQRWYSGSTKNVSLEHAYLATLCGAEQRSVTLRPQLRDSEQIFYQHVNQARDLVKSTMADRSAFEAASRQLATQTPHAILIALYEVLFNPLSGMHSLALGRMSPLLSDFTQEALDALPAPDEPSAIEEQSERRIGLMEFWLHRMSRNRAVWLPGTPNEWIGNSDHGVKLEPSAGKFQAEMTYRVGGNFYKQQLSGSDKGRTEWRRFFEQRLGCSGQAGKFLANALVLSLDCDFDQWLKCDVCTSVIPASSFLVDRCPECRSRGSLRSMAVDDDRFNIFETRMGFYRSPVTDSDSGDLRPFVAEEHTAAIGAIDSQDAFSRAEWHEMRFQDLQVEGPGGEPGGIVDVLSCTTTMEVGIDIGSLTAVSLRNVPPNRANYQQRAGRAGRRGSSLSTVITYADQGTHDHRYFQKPAEMISGPVTDPVLNLDNTDIVRRHGFALILSMFQRDRIPDGNSSPGIANVFSSLGRVVAFRSGNQDEFSFAGLRSWMDANQDRIYTSLRGISPEPYLAHVDDQELRRIPADLLGRLERIGCGEAELESEQSAEDAAIAMVSGFDEIFEDDDPISSKESPAQQAPEEDRAETPDAGRRTEHLLDLLFDTATLPSYAFPTDVVSLTVFDKNRSTAYRSVIKYAPQRGLDQALSSYAPGREVFIDGYRHYSFAIWSPIPSDRRRAWEKRELYFECHRCKYATIKEVDKQYREGAFLDCPSCKEPAGLGPGMYWIEPPGFAHPIDINEDLAIDEPPDITRPTQAKLNAPFNEDAVPGTRCDFGDRAFTCWSAKEELFLTNRGPEDLKNRGFLYCLRCGRIEPKGWHADEARLNAGLAHSKPYPNHREQPNCNGFVRTVTLGTRFVSDVALFRFHAGEGVLLPPGSSLARITLTTIAQAMALVAADSLEIDRANVGAEYRSAQTPKGSSGSEVDAYLYDTTPGGAGFVRAAAKNPEALLRDALRLLEGCTCSDSCYRCLRSYSNRFLHADLDRSLGVSFLRHILNEESEPQLDIGKEDSLLAVLARDLEDSGEQVQAEEGFLILPARNNRRVVLAHALSPHRAGSPRGAAALSDGPNNAPPIDHLRVERALPAAIEDCLGAAVSATDTAPGVPAGLSICSGGCPLYTFYDLESGWPAHPELELELVLGEGSNERLFLLQIDGPQLERLELKTKSTTFSVQQGAVLVCEHCDEEASQSTHNRKLLLIHSPGETFRATKRQATLGNCQWSTFDNQMTIRVSYASTDPRAVPQRVNPHGTRILGRPVGYVDQGSFRRVNFG